MFVSCPRIILYILSQFFLINGGFGVGGFGVGVLDRVFRGWGKANHSSAVPKTCYYLSQLTKLELFKNVGKKPTCVIDNFQVPHLLS